MSFLKNLLHKTHESQPVDDSGSVSAERVIELINQKVSSFRGGRGMVIVIQLTWKVRIHCVNGVPNCSWEFVNDQLCLSRIGETLAEEAMIFRLQKDSFGRLQKELKSYFHDRDFKVTPLSQYENETWAMRISFG